MNVDIENHPWIASYTTNCIEFISVVVFSCTVMTVKYLVVFHFLLIYFQIKLKSRSVEEQIINIIQYEDAF